jgi:nucleotide-binding universal stress UspA family protein
MEQADNQLLAKASLEPFAIKNIHVPIDFSDCSLKALRYAVPFADRHQASLTLLYVVPPTYYPYGEFGTIDHAAIESQMRTTGKNALIKLQSTAVPAGIHSEVKVESGPPSKVIVDHAAKMAADLIVIATHGFSGIKHVLIGSVTERVVQHAPCPVLVVREREHEFIQP